MTITTTVSALQSVHLAVSGVKSAPDGSTNKLLPGQVDTWRLPVVLLFPGKFDLTSQVRNEVDATRTYDGIVLVASELSGAGISSGSLDIWALLQSFRDRYAMLIATTEELTGGIVVTRYQDSGDAGPVRYRGKRWAGWTFVVTCWEPS